MPITCPTALLSVAVDPATMTVCVQGTLTGSQVQHPRQPQRHAINAAATVQVIVVAGNRGDAPAVPLQGSQPATIVGDNWGIQGVLVPAPGEQMPGIQLTAIAWQFNALGTLVSIALQPFYGVDKNVGGTDCCAGCIGPTGSIATPATLTSVLSGAQQLLISVPDGDNKGLYIANVSDTLEWTCPIGGDDFTIFVDDTGTVLGVTGPVDDEATTIALNPFSATFNGADFGAVGNVLVTEP